MAGGLVSSCAGIAWRNYVQPRSGPTGSYGASGAIYSVVSFFACVAPTATFSLFGIIPLPAWAFVTGIFLYDGYSAVNQKVSRSYRMSRDVPLTHGHLSERARTPRVILVDCLQASDTSSRSACGYSEDSLLLHYSTQLTETTALFHTLSYAH